MASAAAARAAGEKRPGPGAAGPGRARSAVWACGFFSAAGSLRARNEDRCRLARDGRGGVVVDGMGGHAGGALFAECLSWQIARLLEQGLSPAEALRAAGEKAGELAGVMGLESGGAVAVCASLGADGWASLARVGDARALAVDPDGSVSEPLAARRVRWGARPGAHLGPGQRRPHVATAAVPVPAGGAVLLMSDGAALYPPRDAIARAARTVAGRAGEEGPDRAASRAAEAIVRAAQAHGSPDDATALVMARLV